MSGQRVPAPGKIMSGDSYHLRPAGGAVNVAIAAKRAGANEVALCAAVGEDEFGLRLLAHLQTQKLNLDKVSKQQGATALMHYAVQKGGEAQSALATGIAASLRADVLANTLQAGDHVMVDTLANAVEAYALIHAAKERSAVPYLLFNAGANLPDAGTLDALSWLVTDWAGAEALAAKGFADVAALTEWAAEYGLRHQLHLAVLAPQLLTYVYTFQGAFAWQGLKVEPVDVTGAQEAWLGTLMTALAAGLPEQRAMARAQAAASLSTLALGAQDAMVQNQTLAEWLPDLPPPERIS